jgi:hypothetical protein
MIIPREAGQISIRGRWKMSLLIPIVESAIVRASDGMMRVRRAGAYRGAKRPSARAVIKMKLRLLSSLTRGIMIVP